jgi:hypothetical protein
MIRHFYLDKTNSIIKCSEQNLGLNPILHVGYGNGIMRSILHFDVENIKCLIEDKTISNLEKLKITLKMVNCFSVDGFPYEKNLIRGLDSHARRAASFDLMLYKLPRHFDGGRGFDFISDMWIHDNRSFSKEGSNWYCCKTGILWDGSIQPKPMKNIDGDIYPKDFVKEEYEKFLNGEESIVIGTQHFDFGNENLSIDITDYVLEVIKHRNDINYGLCLSFTPEFENVEREMMQYVGFFNENTNTFFHPYLEVDYSEYIKDDRESFTNGRENRLYLYVSDDGFPINLDTIPSCTIDGVEMDVKQATKGVYYAQISPSNISLTEGLIEYDVWSKIALNGVNNDDVEMEFVVNPKTRKFSVGSNSDIRKDLVPSFYGIDIDETIEQGEVREITVDFRQKYTTDKKELIDSADYRLYVKDGNREYDVIKYQPVEKAFLNNFFMLYTEDLIPNQYFVDIRVQCGREIKYYREALRFKVVSNVTERYQ